MICKNLILKFDDLAIFLLRFLQTSFFLILELYKCLKYNLIKHIFIIKKSLQVDIEIV